MPFRRSDYRVGFSLKVRWTINRRTRYSTTRSWKGRSDFRATHYESLENSSSRILHWPCQWRFLLMEVSADRGFIRTAEPISFIRDSCTYSSARLLLSDFRTLRSLVIDSDVQTHYNDDASPLNGYRKMEQSWLGLPKVDAWYISRLINIFECHRYIIINTYHILFMFLHKAYFYKTRINWLSNILNVNTHSKNFEIFQLDKYRVKFIMFHIWIIYHNSMVVFDNGVFNWFTYC